MSAVDELQQARAEINEVDAGMAALFERRMAAVRRVLEYKRAHGLPVLDAGREKRCWRAGPPGWRTQPCGSITPGCWSA